MTAMHLGKTASEAVQIAIEMDPNCGGGMDALNLVQEEAGEPLRLIR